MRAESANPAFVPLAGSNRSLLPGSRRAGSIDPVEIASVTVRTRSKVGKDAIEREVRKLYAKPLSGRKYLTLARIANEFGARSQDFDAIERYAQQHGMTVSYRNAAERSLVLTGKLGRVLNAFPANVHVYHHASGTYRGRQGEILIPREFAGIITGIFGLDTRPKHKAPRHARARAMKNGPGGDNGVASTEFAQRYNFPATYKSKTLDGSGQCIGIIELGGGFNNSDLEIYFNEIGVPLPSVTAVSVDRGRNGAKPNENDGEVMLDIEVAGAVAPGAKQVVYFAPNTGKGFLDAISHAVHDGEYRPGVISISWGEPDDYIEQQQLDAFQEIFQAAALAGVTVCAATGDHGSADLDGEHWDQKIHVDHPACDPLVLACGGTQIDSGKDVAWNDGTDLGAGGWSGGGGVSTMFALPDYQEKANVPKSLVNGKVGRGTPDISMSATNYFERYDGSEGPSGGTSAVAPLMAALVALLSEAKSKRIGFLNPFLYANASKGIVVDVTKGTNAIKGTVKGYSAGTGWDACTGLGTPDGCKILAAL